MLVKTFVGQNKILVKHFLAENKFGSKIFGRNKVWRKKIWDILFLHESSSLVELSLHPENQLNR